MVSFGIKTKKGDVNANINIKGKASLNTKNIAKTDDNFKTEFLKAHNICRKKHNIEPAKWSDELAAGAQKWANTIAKKGKFEHSKPNQRKGLGENIACAGGQPLDGHKATMMWYDEIKDYNFNGKPTYNPNCGHFTQIVWAESTEVGAGKATDKKGMTYVVGRYNPAGNMMNAFEQNIRPPVANDNAPSNDSENAQTPSEDLIVPTTESNVCSAPDTFKDSAAEAENTGENDPENEDISSSEPVEKDCLLQFPNSEETSLLIFEMYDMKEREEVCKANEYDHKTVSVEILTNPIKTPAYTLHPETYLQPGKSYRVEHYCY